MELEVRVDYLPLYWWGESYLGGSEGVGEKKVGVSLLGSSQEGKELLLDTGSQ